MHDGIRRTTTVGLRVDAIAEVDSVLRLIRETLQSGSRFLMTFANPATAVQAIRNPAFARMFESFDLVAPDGIGMVLAIQWLHHCPATRISFDGTSLAPAILKIVADQHLKTVVCGGHPGVADIASQQLKDRYPSLDIIGIFDGYSDREQTIAAINRLNPNVVICGMGLIQESFLLALAHSGWNGLGFTCGGFLDQLSQNGLNYYPRAIDALNLRWAYRLAMEPRRLWRRYLLDYPMFAFGLCKALLRHSPEEREQ